jgi:hypothetical protein
MSENRFHLAAVYETFAAAQAAKAGLVAAGVPAGCILVLDRGEGSESRRAPADIWGRLKARLLPNAHAHHYGEAITRGHPLLLADVEPAQHDAAVAALQAQHPINLDDRVGAWQAGGWDGTYEGESAWEDDGGTVPVGSDGLVGGDLIAGDYGAVGAPIGGSHVDTNILRGTVRRYRVA